MSKRNLGTVAVLFRKLNSIIEKSPESASYKVMSYFLRSEGFTGDFSVMFKPMLMRGILVKNKGFYAFRRPVANLDEMDDILWEYRLINRKYHRNYERRVIARQIEKCRKFLEKNGYAVLDKTINM